MMGKIRSLRDGVDEPEEQPQEQPAEPETVTIRVVLLFMLDGQPVLNAPFEIEGQRPEAGQTVEVAIKLDTPQVLQALEPHIGVLPQSSRVRVWRPGAMN